MNRLLNRKGFRFNNLIASKRRVHGTRRSIAFMVMIFVTTGCVMNREVVRREIDQSTVFDQAAKLIKQNYIDNSGNSAKLDISMRPDISTLMAQMDESAVHWSPEDIMALKNSSGGALGICLGSEKNTAEVLKCLPGSPAERAGLRRGDVLVEIDGSPTAGLAVLRVIRLLQGVPGSETVIKIRDESGSQKTVILKREVISPSETAAARFIGEDIGYLRIEQFLFNTASEVRAAMERLTTKNIRGLVIDLRNNNGSVLRSVAETAALFLKRNQIIVALGGRLDGRHMEFKGNWFPYRDLPIVVLIDGKTGSGAEIFAAGLRDNNRALLIGERSAGIGAIQTVYPLMDGSEIKFRNALAFRPTGTRVDGQAVEPDRETIASEDVRAELHRRMFSFPDLGYVDEPDMQLKTALAILKGTEAEGYRGHQNRKR